MRDPPREAEDPLRGGQDPPRGTRNTSSEGRGLEGWWEKRAKFEGPTALETTSWELVRSACGLSGKLPMYRFIAGRWYGAGTWKWNRNVTVKFWFRKWLTYKLGVVLRRRWMPSISGGKLPVSVKKNFSFRRNVVVFIGLNEAQIEGVSHDIKSRRGGILYRHKCHYINGHGDYNINTHFIPGTVPAIQATVV